MRILRFVSLIFIALFSTWSAKGQSFSLNVDTAREYWVPGGYDVDVHVKLTNLSSSAIMIDWSMASYNLDLGWKIISVCDNYQCKDTTTAGLLSGTTTFTSAAINPAAKGDFKVGFNGDAAAYYTKSYVVLDLSNGAETKKATFFAYKYPTGVSTILLLDNNVSIFPNPAQNYIDVAYSPSSDVKTIALYNMIGKVIGVYKVTDKNSTRCEFAADMPSGIYLVRVADSNGNIIATRKITHQ